MKSSKLLTQTLPYENEAYWKCHVQQCAESGLSKSAYCKQQEVHYSRFIYWAKKLTEHVLSDLVEVKIKPDTKAEKLADEVRCTLQLKNNLCLRIENQQALLTVLAHLS